MSAQRRKVKCCYCQHVQGVEIPSVSVSAHLECASCKRVSRVMLDLREERTSDMELSDAARSHYSRKGVA